MNGIPSIASVCLSVPRPGTVHSINIPGPLIIFIVFSEEEGISDRGQCVTGVSPHALAIFTPLAAVTK